MNVYVETNFVLELAFQQEQASACNELLTLAETKDITLIIPTYSLVEPNEKLTRQAMERRRLQRALEHEIQQLTRTTPYASRLHSIRDIRELFIQSIEEEKSRFHDYLTRLTAATTSIPLTSDVVNRAVRDESTYDLTPQDALVYASVMAHLEAHGSVISCFLNRNSTDFGHSDIVDRLAQYTCRMIPNYEHGLSYIRAHIIRSAV